MLSALATQEPIKEAAPSPTSQDTWLAPSGRLRIGAEGIPLKFQLVKVTQARAAAKAHSATEGQLRGGGGVLNSTTLARALEPTPSEAPSPTATAEGGVGILDKALAHQLGLLSSLVGPEILKTLDVECVEWPLSNV